VLSLQTDEIRVSLFWNSICGASAYTLFYTPYPFTGSIGSVDMGKQTSISVNLWAGAAFYVAVKARNKNVYSNYSNIITVHVSSVHGSRVHQEPESRLQTPYRSPFSCKNVKMAWTVLSGRSIGTKWLVLSKRLITAWGAFA